MDNARLGQRSDSQPSMALAPDVKIYLPMLNSTPAQRAMARPLSKVDPAVYELIQKETRRQGWPDRADRGARISLRKPCSKPPAASLPINTPRAIRASATTVGANSPTRWKTSPGTARSSFSRRNTPTFSLTRDRRPIRRLTARFLQPGDTIMGLDLAHGGHLTHGHKLNFSGKTYHVAAYRVNKHTEQIDFDEMAEIADEYKPKMIIAGGSAYPRKLDFARFREVADSVGAMLMVDMAHISGLVAAGLHANPCEYADIVTSTTHKTLRGPRSGIILAKEKYGAAIDKTVFPGTQGGPLVHIIDGRKAGMLPRSAAAGVRRLFETSDRQCRHAGEGNAGRRLPGSFRAAPTTHLMLVDRLFQRAFAAERQRCLSTARASTR